MIYANSKCDAVIVNRLATGGSLGFATRERVSPARNAFTLVELLVVITILAILASMVLFALAGATESAKDMKTRATIQKLNTIVMQKYESYRTRRVPIDPLQVAKARSWVPATDTTIAPQIAARARLYALRELMRAEIPDGFKDFFEPNPATSNDPTKDATPRYLSSWPSTRNAYRNVYLPIRQSQAYQNAAGNHEESAACLYLFVTKGSGDPDVLEQFAPNEIETGADGMKYFIDGWGKPIRFLRWAPALQSSPLQSSTTTQKDPFDPMNVEPSGNQPTFPMYPYIYSAGPDKKHDIGEQPTGGANYTGVENSPFHPNIRNNVGIATDLNSDGSIDNVDNITNHDLGG